MPIHDASVINDPEAQWTRLREQIAEADRTQLEAAYTLAVRCHQDQWRRTAEGAERVPYIVHPLRVARILIEEWQTADLSTLAAALLHDIIEDTPLTERGDLEAELKATQGQDVFKAVRILTKPNLPEPAPTDVKAARDARYFSQLRAAPEWVRLVKCADRVDNLRDSRAWGNPNFWARYCSETIGWHLYLAHETAAIAEVAIFRELVAGEREIRGRVPVWADGHLIDPVAAALIPEHIARDQGAVGLALRGTKLIVGLRDHKDRRARQALQTVTGKEIEAITISPDALRDAHKAGLYGPAEETPQP